MDHLDCKIRDTNNIIIGNGATELIHYFSSAFVKNGVIIPSPTFCEYELASKRNNGKIINVHTKKNFDLDEEGIIKKANNSNNEVSVIFLCNPNNPTGKNSSAQIIEILEKIKNNIIVLLDESYIEFTNEKTDKKYFINLVKDYKNLAILRSLTKTYGLAGLRIGYAIANKNIISKLNCKIIAWNVNGLAQIAASEALKDRQHLDTAKKIINLERNRVYSILKKKSSINLTKTDANFYLIEILNDLSSSQLTTNLLKRDKILVRDCKTFTGMNDKFIRVAVKMPDENNVLINAIGNTL
jgi:threonine-phosphate decarboxylase